MNGETSCGSSLFGMENIPAALPEKGVSLGCCYPVDVAVEGIQEPPWLPAAVRRVRRAGPWALPQPARVVFHLLEIRCFPESPNPHTGRGGGHHHKGINSVLQGVSYNIPPALGEHPCAAGEL